MVTLATACLCAESIGTISFEKEGIALETSHTPIQGQTDKTAQFTDGVAGQALRLEKNTLSYPSLGAIDINKGALSFWLRPVDWGEAQVNFLPIVALDGGLGNTWQLLLYYVNGSGTGRLLDFRMKMDTKREVIAQLPADHLKQGEWNHIALAWTDMEMRVNLNGEKGAVQSYGLPIKRGNKEQHRLWFMPNNFWRTKNTVTTDLDEIIFFDGFITDSEVKQLYLAHAEKGGAKPSEASIPRASAEVNIDGKLGNGEWDDASRVPLSMMLHSKAMYSRHPAWAMLKNDGKNLLLAFEIEGRITENDATPGARTLVYKHAALAEMDVRTASGKTIQYFIYPNGAWAKLTGPKANWREETQMKSAAQITEKGWTAELSIPLAELEAEAGTLQVNLGLRREDQDILEDNDRWIAWSTAGKGESFIALAGKLTLDAPPVRVESLGNLENGIVDYAATQGVTMRVKDLVEGTQKTYEGKTQDKLTWAGMTEVEVSGNGLYWATNVLIKELATMKTTCHGNARILDFEITLQEGDDKLEKALQSGRLLARISLSDKQGKAIAAKEMLLQSQKTLIKLPFPQLATGYYQLGLEITGEDINFSTNKKFGVPEMDFLGTQEGLEETIPFPWSKPVWKGDSALTNFHEYHFNGRVFPVEAWSFQQPVLKGSSDFQATIDGKAATFLPAGKEEQADTFESLVTTGKLQSGDGKVLLNWKRVIDFDGLVRVDFSIEPTGQPVLMENFGIDFTLAEEAAKIALTPNMDVSWEKSGATVRSPFFIGVTGRKGFAVFTDNNANYVFSKNGHPFMLSRYPDGTARLTASFITGKARLDRKAEYTLAVMATPGKPPRADWRKMHGEGWLAYPGQTMAIRGWSHEKKEIGFYRCNYLAWPSDPASTLKRIEEYRKLGIDCIPYCTNNMIPDENPLFDYFAKDWERAYHGEAPVSVPGTDFDGTKFHLFVPVCPNVPQFRDYLCYYTARNMDKFDYKGIYFDAGGTCTTNRPYNLVERERVLTPERPVEIMNIFGTRELYKRLYKLIKKRYAKGYLYIHNWRGFHPAFMSFVDAVNPGEEFMHSFPVNTYVYMNDKDYSSPGLWQYNYSSEAMGAAVQFLSSLHFHPKFKEWFGKSTRSKQERQAEMFEAGKSMIAMCLLHDVQMSGAGYPPIKGLWPVLDQQDISSGTFHPYWEQTALKTDNRNVKVSYYDWQGLSRKLIVLANLESKPATVKLSGTNARLVEAWPENATFDSASIQIDGYSFRLLKEAE